MIRVALLAVLAAACGGDDTANTPDAATNNVDANTNKVVEVTCPGSPDATVMAINTNDTSYLPMATTISVNGVVRFEISSHHDVTPNPLAATTDPGLVVASAETKCLRFTEAGTYGFFCTPHGFTGTITVQ